ncbi:MAG: M50 family metallopeptidase, partial [Elusimicrobiota bacterium]
PADKAGIQIGDKVTAFGGRALTGWEDLASSIHRSADKEITLSVERAGKAFDVKLTPQKNESSSQGVIGIMPKAEYKPVGLFSATGEALHLCWRQSKETVTTIGSKLWKRERPDLAGPVGIFQMVSRAARSGWEDFVFLIGFISVAIGFFNLLPLPMLDGGKLLVSLLPKSLYARWTHDPNLPLGYQSLYKRIYEGPANILSKLHIHDFGQINALTRAASLTALGAFYAAFFSVMSVPLLFLALPCSYDYWCIREKVRSEAAVKDLMELMSQWSAVIVKIADDLGVQSEVSAYETEHAMKNALETLLDELMAKEDFRALTEEQKLDALLKVYPDKAAQYLKDKAMPEDSLEKIKQVLL